MVRANSSLEPFVFANPKAKNLTIDFSNSEAIKELNKAILYAYYNIDLWDIPDGYLCPPIPNRADYIHYINDRIFPTNDKKAVINILDIGVGANCIYPIVGVKSYGWNFVGSDVDPIAIRAAKTIVQYNSILKSKVEIRLQKNTNFIFNDIVKSNDIFQASICNPPFYSSLEEAQAMNQQKNLNLKQKNIDHRNFGGSKSEISYQGGEFAFVQKMMEESETYKNQIKWFTTLISQKENYHRLIKFLKKINPSKIETIEISQGNKISRILAWTFK